MPQFSPLRAQAFHECPSLTQERTPRPFVVSHNPRGVKVGQAAQVQPEREAFLGHELQNADDPTLVVRRQEVGAIAVRRGHDLAPARVVVDGSLVLAAR